MTPEQLIQVSERRAALHAQLQALRAEPPNDDDSKAGKKRLRDWAYDVQSLEKVVAQLDRTIGAAMPPTPAAEPVSEAQRATWVQRGTTIASIPKGKRAELRVSINEWQGARTIDLRLWYQPKDGGDWGPSRKGVSIEASKLGMLLEALRAASQGILPPPTQPT